MKKGLGNHSKLPEKRISIRLPEKMAQDVATTIKAAGLSIKDRSDWIADSIKQLAEKEEYWLFVQEDWLDRGKNKTIQILLDQAMMNQLTKMVAETQKNTQQENTELKSAVIRTAILQRLISQRGTK